MAVAKSRKSKARRDMRRWANSALKKPLISVEQTTGEKHLRHHVSSQGFYRGKQVIKKTVEETVSEKA